MAYSRATYREDLPGRGRYRSDTPSKYAELRTLFGPALSQIKQSFLTLPDDSLVALLNRYGALHGSSAQKYARTTLEKWRTGATAVSGQTMERLVALVPRYLSPRQRIEILEAVLKHNRRFLPVQLHTVRVNVKDPAAGFDEVRRVLSAMVPNHSLFPLPQRVMRAAQWLYEDDITAARAMLDEIRVIQNDFDRAQAEHQIELLDNAIASGKVHEATLRIEIIAGRIDVIVYRPTALEALTGYVSKLLD